MSSSDDHPTIRQLREGRSRECQKSASLALKSQTPFSGIISLIASRTYTVRGILISRAEMVWLLLSTMFFATLDFNSASGPTMGVAWKVSAARISERFPFLCGSCILWALSTRSWTEWFRTFIS
jgi:hypothetical protein